MRRGVGKMIKPIEKYSGVITRHPFIVLVIMLLVSVYAIQMIGTIETKKSDMKSMLPRDVDSIATLNSIENEFGSTNSVLFAVEIDPSYIGSDEVRDVRDQRVLLYMNQLTELDKIINELPRPPGIKTTVGGLAMEGVVMEKNIGPDMAKTSLYSLIGILIIILVIFRSIKYGFTPMSTIIFGTVWAMGFVGFIGMGMSSETSGVLSMIMC